MHWLLFIHKIIFSSKCFEPQVLIIRRIQLYTCSIWYCHSMRFLSGPSVHSLSENSPQSLSLTYIYLRRPSYHFNPVPAHNITACGICINTDEVFFRWFIPIVCDHNWYKVGKSKHNKTYWGVRSQKIDNMFRPFFYEAIIKSDMVN